MAPTEPLSIRLEFTSTFEMVDFVEVVGGHVSREIGLDEDTTHWVGVAIRECVINAIKHGNQHDASKRVFVEFATAVAAVPEMTIRVRDQGAGFDPELDAKDKAAGRHIEMPMLALWGSERKNGFVNKPLETWRSWCPHVQGGPVESGHFLAEEAPEATLAALLPFLLEGAKSQS